MSERQLPPHDQLRRYGDSRLSAGELLAEAVQHISDNPYQALDIATAVYRQAEEAAGPGQQSEDAYKAAMLAVEAIDSTTLDSKVKNVWYGRASEHYAGYQDIPPIFITGAPQDA